jgi:hypothetical protein
MGGYKDIDQKGYRHIKVNHNRGQYASKEGAGVNALEGFWAQLKRSIKRDAYPRQPSASFEVSGRV